MYDTRNSGCITTEDMQAAFSKQGYQIPLSEIRQYIQKYDVSKDGQIDFSEFKTIFLGSGPKSKPN